MTIVIDAHAATPLYEFDGNFDSVRSLAYDITSCAYHLKRGGQALIIGPGGGKDVLTALLFGMDLVYGVEINPSVVEIVKEDYGEFGGHLYDRVDVIQASLVDSWAATAAGAFVLAENHVYTLEAFQQYYEHLTNDGILTMTRIFPPNAGQTLRLVALAYEAWKASGVEDPRKHIVVIRKNPIGTLLVKKTEFTPQELSAIHDLCRRLDFELVASPMGSSHPVILSLYESKGKKSFYRSLPYNLEPPVDDKPFFFHMLRLKDILSSRVWSRKRELYDEDFLAGTRNIAGLTFNDNAVFVLGSLMLVVSVLSLLFILGPLWTFRRESLKKSRGKWKLLAYFTCLGLGFMMVEIPLMQKLMLFLGHPIYALAVTLFGLLVFSGIGSFATSVLPDDSRNRWLGAILAMISVLVVAYILLLPVLVHRLIPMPTSFKVILVVAAMFPLGFLMGMPFPLGIRLVDKQAPEMIPWVWGINGATSVFASVLAIAVAITFGFSAAMAVGVFAYIFASAIVLLSALKKQSC
jgi:hypothetical protein